MAVSKRTRFEVLRRDNYTCRYCRSTESELTVDHVTPVALGGTDDPANLVACCKDCNAGKSSTSPDEGTVAQVAEDAIRWAAAMKQAAAEMQQKRAADNEVLGTFYDMWNEVTVRADLPLDWEDAVRRYMAAGLTMADLEDAALIAFSRLPHFARHHFRYFCGVCRNKADAIAERARAIMDSEAGEA